MNSFRRVPQQFLMLPRSWSSIRFLSTKAYQFIKSELKGANNSVGLITLNRPQVLNALSSDLLAEVGDALQTFEKSPTVAAVVITGEGKAFAAGADISEMKGKNFAALTTGHLSSNFNLIKSAKPLIAAVNGYAVSGCELAMACDIIYASDSAKFAQPEIRIGIVPGAGGTQRLTRVAGKSKTMEMVLTGNPISSQEALSLGLVSKVLPPAELLTETIKLAEQIAQYSKVTAAICKAAVESAYETTLAQGMESEKRLSHSAFTTNDSAEGLAAFIEKRKANFTDS